ncbi:FAD dependent oxidoreductase [Hypoxylon trugodes]|uniref:FAD dependent oxidoreductase n=1 Tax=Hypoxylon trugodes TaxID=326681 RepID=UPI00218FD7DC|nr:FAD dependent oxidoreductase [Hypoxylon trugodes]KAI1391455.1 FAD dependent oxidoreductase [Hypoxylon trugodes]
MDRPYPVPNATVPYWRTELHELDSHRSTEELPEKQDIIIVGAGFAGASIAHYLLKESPTSERPSITILEAREACSGATGRNGGHLRPDIFVAVASRMQSHSLEDANRVALFELANASAVVELIQAENIACDLRPVTTADMFVDAAEAAKIKKLWTAMSKLNCPSLSEVTCHESEAAKKVTGVKDAKIAFTYPAHTLWPYKLVMHLLAGAVSRGVNLQTHTPVIEVSDTVDGEGYWTLATGRGDIRAKNVFFATNAYTSSLLPEYDAAIYAARGTVARILPSSSSSLSVSRPVPPLGSCALEMESPNSVDSYYGKRPDGSLLVGGARSAYYHQNKEQWYRNYDDATLIGPTVPYFDNWAERTFEGWEGRETKTERVWTGIMAYSADDSPHIGRVPSKPGLYICAGFNGHGMPNVLLCAKGLAEMIRSGLPFSETGIPASYQTSAARLRKIAEHAAARTTGRAQADIYLKY